MTSHDLTSKEDFDEFVKNKLCVVHFWSGWAEQCTQLDEILKTLSEVHGKKASFARVEAEEVSKVSLQYSIVAVPTVLILKDGIEVNRINGIDPLGLNQALEKLGLDEIDNESFPELTETLNEKIHRIIHQESVVLIMKGDLQQPKCKFSRATLALLKEVMPDIKLASFDILEDEEVRQGIKEYSNWPTFPQLYIEGDLVGGLDVMKELHENAELIEMLEAADSMKTRLKYLTKKAKIMLFMKGSPSDVKCGFSKQMIALLEQNGIHFKYFDILGDHEVRKELKSFSKWPTYPQLFREGKLIGGLDVCQELHENGELKELMD